MILPGGLGGDLARVAVYRHTGNYRWLSPLVAVGAERLSATALLFTTAAFTLMHRAPTLALGAGMLALVWRMLIRHRAAAPGSGRNAVTQPD